MRRKESAIISSSLQSLLLWSGKHHPGRAVRHRDSELLLQRVGEQEGLAKEGNEATYSLRYWRFLYLQTAGGLHQSVHQIITSTLLHTYSNSVCASRSLSNDSPHPFIFPVLALFCVGITLHIDSCHTWSKKRKENKIIFWAKRYMKYIHKAVFNIAPGWAWTFAPATSLNCLHKNMKEEKTGTCSTSIWMSLAKSNNFSFFFLGFRSDPRYQSSQGKLNVALQMYYVLLL